MSGTIREVKQPIHKLSTELDALALLATKNPARHAEIRTKAVLSCAGLGAMKSPKEVINSVFMISLVAGSPFDKKEIMRLKTAALQKTMTPYEIIGAFKELHKKTFMEKKGKKLPINYSSKQMTTDWTNLSIAMALLEPTSEPILPADFDLEKELIDKSVLPKAKNLEFSIKDKFRSKFQESRPQLKTDLPGKPNWAEVLGNLPPGRRGAVMLLLQGSKDDPKFNEAAKELVWPKMFGEAQTENTRINHLLHALPAYPRGRKTLANRVSATMWKKPQSVEIPETTKTLSEYKREQKVLAEIAAENQVIFVEGVMKNLHPSSQEIVKEKNPSWLRTIKALPGMRIIDSTGHPSESDPEYNLQLLKKITEGITEAYPADWKTVRCIERVLKSPLPPEAVEVLNQIPETNFVESWKIQRPVNSKAAIPGILEPAIGAQSISQELANDLATDTFMSATTSQIYPHVLQEIILDGEQRGVNPLKMDSSKKTSPIHCDFRGADLVELAMRYGDLHAKNGLNKTPLDMCHELREAEAKVRMRMPGKDVLEI